MICSIEGCEKPRRNASNPLCYGHYTKQWRYGDPEWKRPSKVVDLVGQRFGSLTVLYREGDQWVCLCDCGTETRARAGTLNRGVSRGRITCGTLGGCRLRTSTPGYRAAHDRVRRSRGYAAEHFCSHCGDAAQQWAYTHDDPDELTEIHRGTILRYSASPDYYIPLCVPCHKRFDMNREDAA